jgi:hypothetical protein
MVRALLVLAVLFAGGAGRAGAQLLPQAPVTLLGGRAVVSASVSASVASGGADSTFNAADYNQDTMRLVELGVVTSIALHPSAFVVADLRAAGGIGRSDWYFRPATLVVGLRPASGRDLTVAAGILQSPFGGASGAYGRENLLIGLPLIYQYRSSLQPSSYQRPPGEPPGPYDPPRYYGAYAGEARDYSAGLPLVDPRGWNAGVRADLDTARAGVAAALTRGTLSNPLSRDDSAGWEASGRASARPVIGLVVGASAARGRYAAATGGEALMETALGLDAEYSGGYWLVRGEVVRSRREVPSLAAPPAGRSLDVTGAGLEGRYRLAPGLYVAARLGRLWFDGWDADVDRMEGGVGWSLSRPVLLKFAYQFNRRPDGARPRSLHRAAVQALLWF